MKIIATAGTERAEIVANRPSWKDMKENYPGTSLDTPTLYDQKIGGKFKDLYKIKDYENTCAVRMSYALNRSGIKLKKSPNTGGSILGGDGFHYWIRVKELKSELATRFKSPDEELNLATISQSDIDNTEQLGKEFRSRVAQAQEFIDNKIAKKNGIIVFEVSGWKDASGHFTLWEGTEMKLIYAPDHDSQSNNRYYFWLTLLAQDGVNRKIIQTAKIKFWELK